MIQLLCLFLDESEAFFPIVLVLVSGSTPNLRAMKSGYFVYDTNLVLFTCCEHAYCLTFIDLDVFDLLVITIVKMPVFTMVSSNGNKNHHNFHNLNNLTHVYKKVQRENYLLDLSASII